MSTDLCAITPVSVKTSRRTEVKRKYVAVDVCLLLCFCFLFVSLFFGGVVGCCLSVLFCFVVVVAVVVVFVMKHNH